jgi:hypothetical protein
MIMTVSLTKRRNGMILTLSAEMNYTYICGGKEFSSLLEAERYANQVFAQSRIVLGIEVKK